MSEEDCKHFNIIYESLLLEGRASNLTKLTLEVVLGQKPSTWLQVMYERLKHLIISSETFWNRMRMGYGIRIETNLNGKNRLLGSEGQEGFQTMRKRKERGRYREGCRPSRKSKNTKRGADLLIRRLLFQ